MSTFFRIRFSCSSTNSLSDSSSTGRRDQSVSQHYGLRYIGEVNCQYEVILRSSGQSAVCARWFFLYMTISRELMGAWISQLWVNMTFNLTLWVWELLKSTELNSWVCEKFASEQRELNPKFEFSLQRWPFWVVCLLSSKPKHTVTPRFCICRIVNLLERSIGASCR